MRKPGRDLFVPTLSLLAITAGMVGCGPKPTAQQGAPPQVVVAAVEQRDVPIVREWIGRLDGSANVDVRARVAGYIDKIEFKEGRLVKAGDVLLKIDPRPLDAQLAQAKAEVSKAIASQGRAEADEQRQTQLFKNKVASQQDYDHAVQNNLAAKAAVEAARAAQKQAELDVEYATIASPIDGIVGRTDFSIGDYVAAGTGGAAVTTVSTVDPIKFVFAASEKEYLEAADKIQKMLAVPEEERQQKAARIEMIRADGKVHPEKGWFVATDREVDAKTGTIRVSLHFPNPGNVLRPGQYARIRIPIEDSGKGVLVIPQRAVVELQGKNFVWVVDEANKTSQRAVTVGDRVGSDWIIQEGLKPGERIVVDGVQKVREGAPVSPVSAQPTK